MALALMIDGVNQFSKLMHETLNVSQTADGLNSTCNFNLLDEAVIRRGVWTVEETRVEDGDVITDYIYFFPTTKVEVSVADGATVYFAGILSRITVTHVSGKSRVLRCDCHDFNQIVEELVVDDLEEFENKTGAQIITSIFDDYAVGSGIDYVTFVDAGGYNFDAVSFENVTLRKVLDVICAQSEWLWYIDYSKKLHYQSVGAAAPGWHLSDRPNNITSFGYFDDIRKGVDATNLVNKVFIVGGNESSWYENAASIVEYGTHKAIIRDTSIIDSNDLQGRGDAVLTKYKDPVITYLVKTHKTGLRAGEHIRLVNALYDVDEEFQISKLIITFPVDGDPVFNLTCGGLVSYGSASVQRILTDDIYDGQGPIGGSDLALVSRGWSHDLDFSATDHDTVAWGAGDITCVGGSSFSINAGNTDDPGAMAAVTYVYLDTAISVTDLQLSINASTTVGTNRILIAVCAPVAAGKDARFQVYGGGNAEVGVFINANNVATNTLTANEIAANTITAAEVAAHTLTGDQMGFITLSGNTIIRTAVSPATRIELNTTFLAGYSDAATKQFYLNAADGKAYAGGGVVVLDEDGITINSGAFDVNNIKFDDLGTIRARVEGNSTAIMSTLTLVAGYPRTVAAHAQVVLHADAAGALDGAKLWVVSEKTGVESYVKFEIGGGYKHEFFPTYFRCIPGKIELVDANYYVVKSGTNVSVFTASSERLRINAGGIDIAAGDSIHFGLGASFWLTRVGEDLIWHNSTGDHTVQVA